MTSSLEDEVKRMVASIDNEQSNQEQETPKTTEQETEPAETIHIHYFPDAIVLLKEEDQAQVVDSAPVIPEKISHLPVYAICGLYLLCVLATIAFQVYGLLNPPIATITIVPKSQTVTLTGTLPLGRLLIPITVSQSQTAPTTGKGHQDPKQATGFITFYNGQLQTVTIPTGTLLTGNDGVQIVTDQDANIPAEKQTIPPTFGQATVSAHAIHPGARGNIPTGDVNLSCCSTSLLAQNTAPFHGGQDERNYQTVATSDIPDIASRLKAAVEQSTQAALQINRLQSDEVFLLPCAPTVTSDHQPGQEASTVTVTASETCSAVAYNREEVRGKVTDLLIHQVVQTLGIGYSLVGEVQVTIKQATITTRTKPEVLSFTSTGTWFYALTNQEQQRIKKIIAGKPRQEAIHLLSTMPGIQRVTITGIADNNPLPLDPQHIKFLMLVRL